MGSLGDLYLNGKISTYGRNVVAFYLDATLTTAGAVDSTSGDVNVATVAKTGTGEYTITCVGGFTHLRRVTAVQVQASTATYSAAVTSWDAAAGEIVVTFADKADTAANPASGDHLLFNVEVDCVLP